MKMILSSKGRGNICIYIYNYIYIYTVHNLQYLKYFHQRESVNREKKSYEDAYDIERDLDASGCFRRRSQTWKFRSQSHC